MRHARNRRSAAGASTNGQREIEAEGCADPGRAAIILEIVIERIEADVFGSVRWNCPLAVRTSWLTTRTPRHPSDPVGAEAGDDVGREVSAVCLLRSRRQAKAESEERFGPLREWDIGIGRIEPCAAGVVDLDLATEPACGNKSGSFQGFRAVTVGI